MISASYLSKSVHRQDELLVDAKKYLKRFEPYDAIVGTGLSGALAIPLIAFKLKKRFCIVRKTSKSTHSATMLEGNIKNREDRWIFVDDLIDSGRTFKYVCDRMTGYSKFIGVYLYSDNDTITPDKVNISVRSSFFLTPKVVCKIQNKLWR